MMYTMGGLLLTRGVEETVGVAGPSWGAGSGCSRPSLLPILRCLRFNSECNSGEREKEE